LIACGGPASSYENVLAPGIRLGVISNPGDDMTVSVWGGCAVLSGALIMLAACGQQSSAEADGAAETVEAACETGSPLPITGLCSDGRTSLFLAANQKAEMFGPRCVWRTEEVSLSDSEALVFRAQDCSGQGWDKTTYTYEGGAQGGHVKTLQTTQSAVVPGFALEIFPLAAGETAEQAAMKTLEKAEPSQRSRCETRPLTNVTLAGRGFELAPNAELKAELDAAYPAEPWDACGPNGLYLDSIAYWEGRDRHALFHTIGQDTPIWDPASFTFYKKGADGAWMKQE